MHTFLGSLLYHNVFALKKKQIATEIVFIPLIHTFSEKLSNQALKNLIIQDFTTSALGVIVGGVVGHALCTGLAVLMGRFVAQRIPVQWNRFFVGFDFLMPQSNRIDGLVRILNSFNSVLS
ncbi:unnamed protein product [Schistosoma curassoni]|uniref:GDT1 family protein n=1 Tax=Schistosoma curassoni TaxID=6186 RepID=A0A183KIQ8_9TREM|nr:unnamed protein product [Schistosoma curassoni]